MFGHFEFDSKMVGRKGHARSSHPSSKIELRDARASCQEQSRIVIILMLHAPAIHALHQRKRGFAGTPRHEALGSGQVAQVVERSPEKAGVGGSTPSLATIISRSNPET
jgi:hypothetical protein